MNKNLKKHWALAACALCLSGLHAQWDFAATSAAADTTATTVVTQSFIGLRLHL